MSTRRTKSTLLSILVLISLAGAQAIPPDSLNPKARIPVADSVKIPVLDFKNVDIRDVLRGVGMQYGVNIYLDPEVKGTISLYLTNVKVADAIDFIVKRKNYAYVVDNGIVKVINYEPPAPPPPPEPPVVFSVKDGQLTVDVKELAAARVARLFTDSAGINVVVEGQAGKAITSRLKGIDPEKALKVMFESAGYDVTVTEGIYYVSQASWGVDDKSGGAQNLRRLSITVAPNRHVTIEVNDASLDQVVRTIAVQSGINIFIYEKLTGTITAKCDSVYIDDAMRFLLQNTKYNFWKDREIYFIGSREMSQQKTTVVVPLRHIMANEAEISRKLPPAVTRDAVVKYDNEHNAVILIGSIDVVSAAQEFLERIDKPVPQVLIEALVVDFNVDKIREFGVSVFTGGLSDSGGNWRSESFLPEINLKPGRKKTERALTNVLRFFGANSVVKLPENFRSSLHALETANVVKVHSTPQIATISGNDASITIGETRYYKLTKETIAPGAAKTDNLVGTDERFEVLKFNTQLQVTPWVMDSGYVMVEIRPEFNIPRSGGDPNSPPNVDTRVLESMVRLRDGQTIVLGGQRQTENVVRGRGVPFLSSVPIIGWLFSDKRLATVETQMMIFLTPHVYYGDEASVQPDEYFGDEINKMMEKHDPKVRREKMRERRELRKKGKNDAARGRGDDAEMGNDAGTRRAVGAAAVSDTATGRTGEGEKKRKFRWPWQRRGEKDDAARE